MTDLNRFVSRENEHTGMILGDENNIALINLHPFLSPNYLFA